MLAKPVCHEAELSLAPSILVGCLPATVHVGSSFTLRQDGVKIL